MKALWKSLLSVTNRSDVVSMNVWSRRGENVQGSVSLFPPAMPPEWHYGLVKLGTVEIVQIKIDHAFNYAVSVCDCGIMNLEDEACRRTTKLGRQLRGSQGQKWRGQGCQLVNFSNCEVCICTNEYRDYPNHVQPRSPNLGIGTRDHLSAIRHRMMLAGQSPDRRARNQDFRTLTSLTRLFAVGPLTRHASAVGSPNDSPEFRSSEPGEGREGRWTYKDGPLVEACL